MHILVIGAGAIGFQLSKQLSQDGHDITQIDTDPSRVKRVSEQLDIIVAEGNGTSLQDLRGIGIKQGGSRRRHDHQRRGQPTRL